MGTATEEWRGRGRAGRTGMNVRAAVWAGMALGGLAALAPAWGAQGTADVPMVLKESPENAAPTGFTYIRLDANGQGEIPFATAAGKLAVKKEGEKLRVDTNGDGVVDAQDAPACGIRETVKVPVRWGGRAVDYTLRVLFLPKQFAGLGGACWLEGTVGQTRIRIRDQNLNGVFGEAGKDTVAVGEKETVGPLTRVLDLEGRPYSVALAADASSLHLAPYAGPRAWVAFKTDDPAVEVRAGLMETSGLAYAQCEGAAPAPCLAGSYRIQQLMLVERTPGAAPGQVRPLLAGDGNGAILTLAAGTNTLTYGPPFTLAFKAVRAATNASVITVQSAALVGKGGETYRACDYANRPGSALVCLVRAGNEERKLATLEYG